MDTIKYDVELGDLEIALEERNLNAEEQSKEKHGILGGEKLRLELEDSSKPDVDKEVHINLKSHGIYIQFDRAPIKKGFKDWFFMVRCSIWGGGDISPEQWLQLSRLADLYSKDDDGFPSMRLTTRQSIQFHHVGKSELIKLVRGLIDLSRPTLNGCGDNTRNPVACPHVSGIFNPIEIANRIGEYFQLPYEEYLKVFYPDKKIDSPKNDKFEYDIRGLPRKLKIAVGGFYINEFGDEVRCNCSDILTNDIGVIPVVEDRKVKGFQVYIGGGLGQKNMKPTFAALGGAFGIFSSEENLIKGIDAIIKVYQQIGDRKNRHFARLKNVIIKKGLERTGYKIEEILSVKSLFEIVQQNGIEWYQQNVRTLGIEFSKPVKINLGNLNRHHGWSRQYNRKFSFGLWIENGRIKDSAFQGKIKFLVDRIVEEVKPGIRITPYQDILFTNLNEEQKSTIEKILSDFHYGNYSEIRKSSLACVGLSTCSLAVSESEKYFNPLMNELESSGYRDIQGVNIGISGCERHCSRNVRFDISLEGKGNNVYQLKLLFGSAENGNLALDLICDGKKYLRHIPKDDVPAVIKVLLDNYLQNRLLDEKSISEFHKRIGMESVINLFKQDERTVHLMEKTYEPFLA